MLFLPSQGDKDNGLTKSLKKINKHFPTTLKCKLHLLVKNLGLDLMLRIGQNLNTNMTLSWKMSRTELYCTDNCLVESDRRISSYRWWW